MPASAEPNSKKIVGGFDDSKVGLLPLRVLPVLGRLVPGALAGVPNEKVGLVVDGAKVLVAFMTS